jgi:hypothetical protein
MMANLKTENLDRFDCQKTVREALLELDPEKLKTKVAAAEAAIFDAAGAIRWQVNAGRAAAFGRCDESLARGEKGSSRISGLASRLES